MTVHFVPSQVPSEVLVSYSIGRKVGGAVVRNRWRRRLRVIAGEVAHELEPGAYLIGVGPSIQRLSFAQLRERVIDTMRKVNEDHR